MMVMLSEWRRERIFAYMDPWNEKYSMGKGYQLSHSLIAFGRGEIFGVGLGGSIEKLHWLPEAHTDFLMAVIGEEFGLMGVLVVIGLFLWMIRRIIHIGRQSIALDRLFSGLVAQGVGIWMGFQTFINIGVNLGALPTKGLTLPLMSYGGSAIVMNLIALACGAADRLREPRSDARRPRMKPQDVRGEGPPQASTAPSGGSAVREAASVGVRVALVMAGGTGGHIFPGLAVAEALRASGWRVHWLGGTGSADRPSMESQLVPPRGFAFETIDFSGVRGKGLVTLALLPLRLLKAFWQSVQVIRRVKPDVVVGPGRLHHLSGRHDERAAGQAAGAARAKFGGRHGQQGAGRRGRPCVYRLSGCA